MKTTSCGTLVAKVKINKSILWWKLLLVAPWISTMMKTWQTGVMCNSSTIHLSPLLSLILTMLSYLCILAISSTRFSIYAFSFTHSLHSWALFLLLYPITILYSWPLGLDHNKWNMVLIGLLTWVLFWTTHFMLSHLLASLLILHAISLITSIAYPKHASYDYFTSFS